MANCVSRGGSDSHRPHRMVAREKGQKGLLERKQLVVCLASEHSGHMCDCSVQLGTAPMDIMDTRLADGIDQEVP